MSAEDNKALIRAFLEAGNQGDMETAMGLIAEDIVWTNIGTTAFSGTFRGTAELQQKLLGPLFSHLESGIHMTVHRLIAEGDYVAAQMSGTAKTRDGRPYNNTYCWIVRLREGRIVEVSEYMDTELITSALA